MQELTLQQLRYPIGTFQKPLEISPKMLMGWISDIEILPTLLRQAV